MKIDNIVKEITSYTGVVVKWRKKDKYAIIIKDFTHFQIEKFNGTKGYPLMTTNNIGVFNEETGRYDFKEEKCTISGKKVSPSFTSELILHATHLFKTIDSFLQMPHDEDEKIITERFEIRLLKAKTQLDVLVAKFFYEAAQIDRLLIKETILKNYTKQ